MTKDSKSRPIRKKGHNKSNQPTTATIGKKDFVPTIRDETQEGQFTAVVGGVQLSPTEVSFVSVVIDETIEGECIGMIGVTRPPKKTSN